MPYLQLNDKQVQLRVGETRIGAGPEVDFRLPGPLQGASPSVLAIAEVGRGTHVAIRRGTPDAVVRVNGVLLGAEPTPLIHGDKIEINGAELYFGDDKRGGSTQFIPSTNLPDFDRLRGPAPARATAATGGRVISLVDGREYMVPLSGLVFGRDAGCDVVIPSSDVSRRHAEIVAGDTGYVVTDTSTNGLFVNGDRIEGMQILGRGDVLRIGPDEFRFYADIAAPAIPAAVAARATGSASSQGAAPLGPPAGLPGAPPAGLSPVVPLAPAAAPPSAPAASPFAPPPPPAVPAVAAGGPVEVAAQVPGQPPGQPPGEAPASELAARAADAAPAMPAPRLNLAAVSTSRTPIATLEVIGGGLLRGQRYAVTTVIAHLGRGEHNDIVIAEESVSDSHAKLQRRDGVWYVTDLRSTNGTYVGGRRIDAEERLDHSADLRLGGVKLTFAVTPSEAPTVPRGATREFAGIHPADDSRVPVPALSGGEAGASEGRPDQPVRQSRTAAPVSRGGSRWLWLVLAIVVAAAAVVYLLQGR
jgi:pSer/pThr/pTyr-binding forkhead associated (FHA) protein